MPYQEPPQRVFTRHGTRAHYEARPRPPGHHFLHLTYCDKEFVPDEDDAWHLDATQREAAPLCWRCARGQTMSDPL